MCKGFSLRFNICPLGKCGIKVHRNNCTVRLTTLEHIRRAVSPHTWPTLTFTIHPSLAKKKSSTKHSTTRYEKRAAVARDKHSKL